MANENQYHTHPITGGTSVAVASDYNQPYPCPPSGTSNITNTTGYVGGNYGNSIGVQNGLSGYSYQPGYQCGNCGQYVGSNAFHNCYYYAPSYPNHYFPSYVPSQIIIYTVPTAVPITVALGDVEERLERVERGLEKLLDLLHNGQDEKVCGHTEGECESADPQGSTGTSLEVSVKVGGRSPRGNHHWPPLD